MLLITFYILQIKENYSSWR